MGFGIKAIGKKISKKKMASQTFKSRINVIGKHTKAKRKKFKK